MKSNKPVFYTFKPMPYKVIIDPIYIYKHKTEDKIMIMPGRYNILFKWAPQIWNLNVVIYNDKWIENVLKVIDSRSRRLIYVAKTKQ